MVFFLIILFDFFKYLQSNSNNSLEYKNFSIIFLKYLYLLTNKSWLFQLGWRLLFPNVLNSIKMLLICYRWKKLRYKKINISAFMGPDIMLLYIYSSLRFNAAYCYIWRSAKCEDKEIYVQNIYKGCLIFFD